MKKLCLAAALMVSALASAQNVKVEFYTPTTVRIVKGEKVPEGSYAVTASPEDVKVKVSKGKNSAVYMSSKLTVTVKGDQVSFAVNGRDILKEKESSALSQTFVLDPDEAIYGLGILQDGALSLRGKKRYMIQGNTEDFVSIVHSVKGYAIFWDNTSPTTFEDSTDGMSFTSEVGDAIDYYFIYGGNADGVIAGIRQLTGSVPMLPKWSYGFMQSRERYKSSAELLGALHGYRERNIPLDCIIQDWQYWGNNYQWNAMEFLNEDFRRPQAMIDEVHAQGAHMMISIWASFGPMTKPYRELAAKGLLFDFSTWPQSGLSDWPPRRDYPSGVRPYNPYVAEARDIYWKHLLRLENMGIDAWWMDSTEPDHLDFKDSDLDVETGVGSFRKVRNAFPLLSVSGVVENQLKVSERRPLILTRSAWAGQQRTGANTWSGDVQSTWDDFRHQIPAGLGFALTGNPNFNSDCGGFFPSGYNKPGVTQTCSQNPLFQELYVRWLQYGLFCPMMRSHGESSRREIWEFGDPGTPVYDAIEKTIRLRYKLMPYIYSTAWEVSSQNGTFQRALFMDFKNDRNVWNLESEFMFGRNLLVAPVNKALFTREKREWSEESVNWNEAKEFQVYLPAGCKWYELSTGKKFNGGSTVSVSAALSDIPVFARAGSILPVYENDINYIAEKPMDDLTILVYDGANGEFTLYEDEGDNHNYEKGKYSTIKMTLKGNNFTIGDRKGRFEGMAETRKFKVCFVGSGRTVEVDYKGRAVSLFVR